MVDPNLEHSWRLNAFAGAPYEQLRRLLVRDAFLVRGPGQEIVDHRGRPMHWILQSWNVTLTHLGSDLAGSCLLQLLAGFKSTQVAGVAASGLPLAAAVVQAGRGKYQSLFVRSEREVWGARRHVEGVGDRSKPVVIVDDCICGGGSLKAACAALEADGYEVEGAVALVDFSWKGGVEWARGLGLRVETVFDVWRNLEKVDGRGVTTWRDVALSVGAELDPGIAQASHKARTPNGLRPADAARWIAEYWLREGRAPLPPETLEGEYDARGGVVVSFRDRENDRRLARDGFYHLPLGWAVAHGTAGPMGEADNADLCRDVVLATVKALRTGRVAIEEHGLERLKVGVTMFGLLEHATERQLSFNKYAVVVRSQVFPKLEMALPNTQFFTSEIEQLRHARWTNAKLLPHEPHDLFIAKVAKSVEQGCRWPPFGISDTPEPFGQGWDGDKLVARAREWVARAASDVPNVAEDSHDEAGRVEAGDALGINGVTVALYDGGLAGCWAVWDGDLDAMLREAAAGAWRDKRWVRRDGVRPEEMDVVVSVLQRAEDLGEVGLERAAFVLRLGKDTLGVQHGSKGAILLAYIPCHNNWTKREMAQKVLEKAGLSSLDEVCWTTYFTRSWLGRARDRRSWVLENGFPPHEYEQGHDAATELSVIRRMAGYIADKADEDGLPSYCYYPVSDRKVARDSAPRVVLALGALVEAAQVLGDSELKKVAVQGLSYCCEQVTELDGHGVRLALPGVPCGVMAEAFLLNAVYRSGEPELYAAKNVQRLLRRFQGFFHGDGAISWLPAGRRIGGEHDLFPGAALYTMAHVAEIEGVEVLPVGLDRQLRWYRQRFLVVPNWGPVFWQAQGWAAVERVLGDVSGDVSGAGEFVYELMDWALDRQVGTGAFLVDYAPDGPGFHTGCVLEALADGWELALRRGDEQRAQRYGEAWERGRKFLDRLIVREEDTFCMRGMGRALGGVRRSLTSSSVRIDYVAHALLGLVKRFRIGPTGVSGAGPRARG